MQQNKKPAVKMLILILPKKSFESCENHAAECKAILISNPINSDGVIIKNLAFGLLIHDSINVTTYSNGVLGSCLGLLLGLS